MDINGMRHEGVDTGDTAVLRLEAPTVKINSRML
jgi:hypothetical protein